MRRPKSIVDKILEDRVQRYHELQADIGEQKLELKRLSEKIKAQLPDGITHVGEFTVIKTYVPASRVESFDRAAYDKLEVRVSNI